jgi:hypothetical protein
MEAGMIPAHRQIINGRTHASTWDGASYGAAVERPSPAERIASAVLAVVLGIVGAALLAHWVAS